MVELFAIEIGSILMVKLFATTKKNKKKIEKKIRATRKLEGQTRDCGSKPGKKSTLRTSSGAKLQGSVHIFYIEFKEKNKCDKTD